MSQSQFISCGSTFGILIVLKSTCCFTYTFLTCQTKMRFPFNERVSYFLIKSDAKILWSQFYLASAQIHLHSTYNIDTLHEQHTHTHTASSCSIGNAPSWLSVPSSSSSIGVCLKFYLHFAPHKILNLIKFVCKVIIAFWKQSFELCVWFYCSRMIFNYRLPQQMLLNCVICIISSSVIHFILITFDSKTNFPFCLPASQLTRIVSSL